jgi:hypothetical protein
MESLLGERRYFPNLWRHQLFRHIQSSKANAKNLSQAAPKTSESTAMDTNTLLIILVVIFLFGGFGFYGRGRWFWTHATEYASAFISEGYPAIVKPTVERMVKRNADALARAAKPKRRLRRATTTRSDWLSDWCKSRRAPDSAQSFSTAIASQRLRPNRRAADNAAFAAGRQNVLSITDASSLAPAERDRGSSLRGECERTRLLVAENPPAVLPI